MLAVAQANGMGKTNCSDIRGYALSTVGSTEKPHTQALRRLVSAKVPRAREHSARTVTVPRPIDGA